MVPKQPISIALLVSLTALLALVGLQWPPYATPTATSSAPEATDWQRQGSAQGELPQFSLPPIETFFETLARPLFYEARQPPELPAEDDDDPRAQAETLAEGDIVLSAIVLASDQRFALLQTTPQKPNLIRVEEGQEVAGWSVETIRNDSLVLKKGDRTKVVLLWRFEPPPKQRATPAGTRTAPRQVSPGQRREAPPRTPPGDPPEQGDDLFSAVAKAFPTL
ncbi:MAG: hypothetical protein ACFCVA_14145 [Gammaproteobacteria bacterium]